jgi:hypothetical protein
MATPGLSLVGFLEEQPAIEYLGKMCIPSNPDPLALRGEWQAAQAQLGAAIPDAGQSAISAVPAIHQAHVQALQAQPWIAQLMLAGWEIRLAEVDTLLAVQFDVDVAQSNSLAADLRRAPTVSDALPLCLPLAPPAIPAMTLAFQHPDPQRMQSLVVKSQDLNVRIVNKGLFGQFAGIELGVASPLVHVVRFNGRTYLQNGFHRAYAFRSRGLMQIPCFYREVAHFNEVAVGPPATFSQALLESANPPTLGHFAQNRAYPVTIRRRIRSIHISWTDRVLPDE